MKFQVRNIYFEISQKYLMHSDVKILKERIVDFESYNQKQVKTWLIDCENNFALMSINLWEGKRGPWDLSWEDICVLSEDGSIALISQCGYSGNSVLYRIVYVDGAFEADKEKLKDVVDGAVKFAGMRLNGSVDASGYLVRGIGLNGEIQFLD